MFNQRKSLSTYQRRPHRILWAGFTLIELLVVIAVVAILTLLATPKFVSRSEEAKLTRDMADAKVLETTLDAYRINHGLPSDGQILSEEDYQAALAQNRVVNREGVVPVASPGPYMELTKEFVKKTLKISKEVKGTVYTDSLGVEGNI